MPSNSTYAQRGKRIKSKPATIVTSDNAGKVTTTTYPNVPRAKGGLGKGSYSGRSKGSATYGETNTSGNSRQGQKFRTVVRKGGEVHEYADGTRVFVKKKAQKNPARKLY